MSEVSRRGFMGMFAGAAAALGIKVPERKREPPKPRQIFPFVKTVTSTNCDLTLPSGYPGLEILITGRGDSSIRVYAQRGETVNGHRFVVQSGGKCGIYICGAPGRWMVLS